MQSEIADTMHYFYYFCAKNIVKVMKHILLFMAAFLVLGCNSNSHSDNPYLLQGAWTLQQLDYPVGHTETYEETKGTFLRLYDRDSTLYEYWLVRTESGLIVKPNVQRQVTLIDKGGGEHVYLEDDDPRPLTVKDDSTIIIQRNGILSTWHRADDITNEWSEEIIEIFGSDVQKENTGEQQSYMLSAKERQQANVIHGFILTTIGVIILLLLIARIAIDNRKARSRLQLQLQQIQEVQEERPQSVRKAIESVENAYFASDEYQTLQCRIATGQRLKDEDWFNVESQIRKVYPGFSSQLRGLHTMSELEYQVCLLIKLRIAPSDIATILARDVSTISTVRSRLYKKVFDRKGGAREWDEFILSIGA